MDWRTDRRFRREWLWIPFASLGFIIYLCVNASVWNDPFYFRTAMQDFWGKRLSWPWTGVMTTLTTPGSPRAHLFGIFELAAAALGLAEILWSARALRPSYTVWMALNWILITSTTVLMSTPRYLLSFFPMFILFALAMRRPMFAVMSAMFMAMFACLFGLGLWAF